MPKQDITLTDEQWFALPLPERLYIVRSLDLHRPIDTMSLHYLLKAAQDPHPELHTLILQTLQRLGSTTDNVIDLLSYAHQQDLQGAQGQLLQIWTLCWETLPNLLPALLDHFRFQSLREESHTPNDFSLLLGAIGTVAPPLLEAMLQLLHNQREHDKIRIRAACVLAYIQQPEAIYAMLSALHGDEQGVRSGVAAALRFIQHPDTQVLQALCETLHRGTTFAERSNAARALGEYGPQAHDALPYLHQALHDTNPEVRRNAAWAIGTMELERYTHIDVESLVTSLDLLLQNEREQVSKNAAWSLGTIGQRAYLALPGLQQALGSPFKGLRLNVALALGRIGPAARLSIPSLLHTLHDPDTQVRGNVAWALGRIGISSPEVLDALQGALQDHATSVQMEAATALIRLHATAQLPILAVLSSLAFHVGQFKQHIEQQKMSLAAIAAEDLSMTAKALQEKTAQLLFQTTHPPNSPQHETREQLLRDIQTHTKHILHLWTQYLRESKNTHIGVTEESTQALQALHNLLLEDVLTRWQHTFEEGLFDAN